MSYRLWPSTNGPSSSADSENLSYGTAFKVTGTGMVLQGYWYWRADSTASASAAFALWQITGTDAGTYLGSSTYVTTSTMVAGQWNYVPLATPYALTANTPYKAVAGVLGTHNLVYNQFGAGNPYSAGITNGPLVAFSAASGSNPDPYGGGQCTAGGSQNPTTVFPTASSSSKNPFVDFQVDYATTAVSGADTGGGADSGTVAVSVSDADTGAGADSGSVPGVAAGADSGAGADGGSVTAALSDADSGAGADSGSVTAAFTAADTGGGADTGAVAAAVSGADTAGGADSGTSTGVVQTTTAGAMLAFIP